MAKQKKIGFKYFLNKRMKMSEVLVDAYPLYVQVTFNRTSTKMQPYTRDTLYWTEQMLDDFITGISDGHKHTLRHYEMVRESISLIEKMIRFEHNRNSEFGVNYLGRLNAIYQEKTTDILVPLIIQELKPELAEFMIAKNYLEVFKYENTNSLDQLINTIFNFHNKGQLEHFLSNRMIFLLEAFSGYLEFLEIMDFSEFKGSIFNWIIGEDRVQYEAFLKGFSIEKAQKRITKDFLPKKVRAFDYAQLIDNELNKALMLVRK